MKTHGGARQSRRIALTVGIAVGLLALLTVLVAHASAESAKSKQAFVTVRTKFTRLSGVSFLSSSRYVFTWAALGRGVLIDDTTGRRHTLTFPSTCGPEALGGTHLALYCGSSNQALLYDITTGRPTALPDSPTGFLACNRESGCPQVTAIGSHWAALELPMSSPDHAPVVFAFENLQTGQAVADPTTPTTTVDLNSPALSAPVCPPLSVPQVDGESDQPVEHGALTPVGGGFEIATGTGVYLERCGTHLHERLTPASYQTPDLGNADRCAAVACPPTANSHAVIWPSLVPGGQLDGMFLPSRQRFIVPVPAKVDPSYGTRASYTVGLTAHHLYLSTGTAIWKASLPRPPKQGKARPTKR